MVVDKPHHVTLQKQKGEMGDGLLEVECWILCVCAVAANEGGGQEVRADDEGKQNREWTFPLKRSSK